MLSVLLFFGITIALAADYAIDKELSADGVNYFYLTVELRDFTHVDASRRFAQYILEWPLVLALRFGVTHFYHLKAIFCIGLFLPYLISFGLCLYAVRKGQSFLMLFPLISMIGVNLASDYILAGEHQVMVLLSWPAVLFSLRPSIHWSDAVLTWALLVLLSATYPIAAFTVFIVACIMAFRLYRRECRHARYETAMNWITLGLAMGVMCVTTYSILAPLHPANRDSFAISMSALLHNPLAIGGLATTVVYAWMLHRSTRIVYLVAWLPALGYLVYLSTAEHGVGSGISFSSRTLSLTALPTMLAAAAISRRQATQARLSRSLPVAAFIIMGVTGVIVQGRDWADYRKQFKTILETRTGFVPIEETPLRNSGYGWPWNNPLLSVVWSYPCVRSMMLNAHTVTWQQFDPAETLILKSYVGYASPLASIDPTSTQCE
jgi:hypothetical protein